MYCNTLLAPNFLLPKPLRAEMIELSVEDSGGPTHGSNEGAESCNNCHFGRSHITVFATLLEDVRHCASNVEGYGSVWLQHLMLKTGALRTGFCDLSGEGWLGRVVNVTQIAVMWPRSCNDSVVASTAYHYSVLLLMIPHRYHRYHYHWQSGQSWRTGSCFHYAAYCCYF